MKFTYKDFDTGKPRWTRGRFVGWHGPDGPLNVMYAHFDRGRSSIFVPEYCLTNDTKRTLDYETKCRETPERVMAECPAMVKPATEYKHLFGIIDNSGKRNGKRLGYFLANSPERNVNRDVAREMFEEARAEGLDRPLFIYCATCTYNGPSLEIIQIGWEG